MNRANGAWITGLVLFAVATTAAVAQAQQPTVVVSIRGLDEFLDDVDLVGETVGHEGAKSGLEDLIKVFTNGKELAGIDRSKPFGFYWNAGRISTYLPVFFLPVSDANELKGLLKDLTTDFKEEGGQWTLTFKLAMTHYAKVANGYCFITALSDELTKLPDPAELVNTSYDLNVNVDVAGIPEGLKQLVVAQREVAWPRIKAQLPKARSRSEEIARDSGFNISQALLKLFVNEVDRVTIGMDVNSKTRQASMDMALISKPDSDLSKAFATYGKMTPLFPSMGDESAPFRLTLSYPTMGITSQIDMLIDGLREYIFEKIAESDQLTGDDDRSMAKDFVKRIFEIARATARTGVMHSGLMVQPDADGDLRIVAGTNVARGADVSEVMDEILNLLKDSPEVAEVRTDAATHGDAQIHAVTPKFDEDVKRQLGDGPLHLTVRDDTFWVAMGGDNLSALIRALDQFGKTPIKTTAPISIQMKPAALVLLIEKDDTELIKRAQELIGKPTDKLNMEILPVSRGVKLHAEFGIDLFELAPPQ